MYKKYLGITVPNDAAGYLQDTHWATGLVGYFSSYALGSAYSAQMFDTMLKDIDIWPAVRRGDLAPVTCWLREKIHRHGQMFTPQQAFFPACGADFEPKYYIDYLTRKFTTLYRL